MRRKINGFAIGDTVKVTHLPKNNDEKRIWTSTMDNTINHIYTITEFNSTINIYLLSNGYWYKSTNIRPLPPPISTIFPINNINNKLVLGNMLIKVNGVKMKDKIKANHLTFKLINHAKF